MFFGTDIQSDFILDNQYVNINNGSMPVASRIVYEYAQQMQYGIAKNPTKFYNNDFPTLLEHNKIALAKAIGGQAKDIALTSCTTDSMNAVLRTLVIIPGDEILIDMNAYISHRRIAEFVSARGGARLVKVDSPFPIWATQEYIDAYINAITPRTRLVILEDICSSHGLDLPIEPIIDYCRSRSIQVLVAGANAVAVRKINVQRLGVNWYVGSCHKWGLAMRGAGFIWASEDSQNIRPTSISKCNHKAYPDNFSWAGSRDYTAWMTIAKGLEIANTYKQNGADTYCRDLMIWAKDMLAQTFCVADIADDDMVGKMGVVMLPASLQTRNISTNDINQKLLENNIIALCSQIYDKKILRLSADIFNTKQDYKKCADVILQIEKSYS